MVFSGNDFIAGATSAFSTSKGSAFVDWLIDATEQVVFVILLFLSVVFISSGGVRHFGDWHHLNGLFPDFINNLTRLHSLHSDSVHLCLGDRGACNSLHCVNSHECFSSYSIEVTGRNEFSVRDEGVSFLCYNKCTKFSNSRVLSLLYCLLTSED